jgi:ssDNA-binding Zn-finger/Zn-ribbon topoisomerase 1
MAEKLKSVLVGHVNCAECGAESEVRENKNKKVFYNCPECGLIYPNSPAGNARLRAKMRPITPVEEKNSDPKKGDAEVAGGVPKPPPARSEKVKKTKPPPETPKPPETKRAKFEGFL